MSRILASAFLFMALFLGQAAPCAAADFAMNNAADFRRVVARAVNVIEKSLADNSALDRDRAYASAILIAACAEFGQNVVNLSGLPTLYHEALQLAREITGGKIDDARKRAAGLTEWQAKPGDRIEPGALAARIYTHDLMILFAPANRGGRGGEAQLLALVDATVKGKLQAQQLNDTLLETAYQVTAIGGLLQTIERPGPRLEKTRQEALRMTTAGRQLAGAVKAKDPAAAGRVLVQLVDTCTSCHNATRRAKTTPVLAALSVDELRGKLQDPLQSAGSRASIALALGFKARAAQEAIPDLIDALNHQSPVVQREVALALERIGPPEHPYFGLINETVPETRPADRHRFADRLQKVGKDAKKAVALLREDLDHKEADVRAAAATLLARLGPEAKEAAPALEKALKDPDAAVRRAATGALHKLGLIDEVVVLIESLKETDPVVRGPAAVALGKMGAPAVAGLIEVLKSEKGDPRAAAAFALGKIGPDAKAAIPALRDMQKGADEYLRLAASQALKKIEVDPKP